jgi:hypothetical protein
MKVPLLLTLGLCLSVSLPALSQNAGGQQQQNQQHTQQKNKDRTHTQAHSQAREQTRQHDGQPAQQQRQQTQQQTRPMMQQQQRQQTQQQMRTHVRERFSAPNAPPRETTRNFQPRYYRMPNGSFDRRPMYRNGTWYGRSAPNDPRFRLRQPFARGHFYQYGPSYYHRIIRFNRANYWFWLASGYYFQIASWDWPYCSDWCWDCGDDFLIYLDPDHPGWYLVLNVQTGVYVHATFMGR